VPTVVGPARTGALLSPELRALDRHVFVILIHERALFVLGSAAARLVFGLVIASTINRSVFTVAMVSGDVRTKEPIRVSKPIVTETSRGDVGNECKDYDT
jgi:hypothetical protein